MTLRNTLVILGFVVAGLTVFGSSLGNQFVTWDDGGLIVDNVDVSRMTPATVKHVFTSYDPELYIPLTFVTYQLNHLIGGSDPMIYHATNLAFHIANALLVVWLLSLLMGSGWLPVALGVVFLVHPLNAEAVSWASARKDVLSTFFFLTSLIAYISWRSDRRAVLYGVSLALFLLGLLSKVMVITLPVVFLLLDLLEQRKDRRSMVIEKLPFFALSVVFGIVALLGKTTVLAASTPWQKVLMACKSTMFYLQKFAVPYGLSVVYPYTKPIHLFSFDFFPWVLLSAALIVAAWKVRKKWPLITFGISFYLLTLAPTFTNFSKGNDNYFASDRYVYIPMIGILMVIGVLFQEWMGGSSTVREDSAKRKATAFVVALIVSIYATLAHTQSLTWNTSGSLYRHALEFYPNSRAAHHNLGMEFLIAGDPKAAIDEFTTAQSIKDDPRTHISKGAALVALKRYEEATKEYATVIGMDPQEPDAYYGLGNVAYKLGNLPEAIVQYQKAISVRPDYTNAINNLGAIYIELKDWDHAIETLKASIKQRPDFPESYYNLAGAEERKGLLDAAEADYRSAIALSPGDADALASLASLLYRQKRIPEAADLLKQALAINQENTIGLALLGQMQRDGIVR